jgi:uncharacterized protein YjeT (DUF2065 family)
VDLNWSDLLAALALILVLEGIVPFVSPARLRRTLAQLATLGDRELRIVGFGCMLAGVLLLFVVRS